MKRFWGRSKRALGAAQPREQANIAAGRAAPAVSFIDEPQSDPAHDLLGRTPFAQRVASTIAEATGTSSVVVGLYGPWGDGKTSLLGFIESELRSKSAAVPVRFNPWFHRDEAQIAEDFFRQVGQALGVDLIKVREKAARKARQYGPTAEAMPLPGGVGKLVGAAGVLVPGPSLRDLRDRLTIALEAAASSGGTRRIVVLVDDIDRLDADQIATVFRVIKLAADFPNISYLLAFDPKVVGDALASRYLAGDHGSGAAFLEKIVQVPLTVPRADPSRVAALMNQWLAEVMKEHCPQLSFEESTRLHDTMDSWVWPQVTTLRAGKRLLSTVKFVVPLMSGEVSPVDQVLLESLRVLYLPLYTFAAKNKRHLALDLRHTPGDADVNDVFLEALAELPGHLQAGGTGLLEALFPVLARREVQRQFSEEEVSGWYQAKRVASPSHFDRYFGYGLPVGDILDADVDAAFAVEAQDAAERLTDLFDSRDIGLVIQKLIEQARDKPADVSGAVAIAVVGLSDRFSDAPDAYRADGLAARAGYLIALLLRNIPAGQREELAHTWIQGATPWFSAMCLNMFASALRDATGEMLLHRDFVQRLARDQAHRFGSLPTGELFSSSQLAAGLLIYGVCYEYGDRDDIERLMATALKGDKDLLDALLAEYLPAPTRFPFVNAFGQQGYAQLASIVPADTLHGIVNRHYPNGSGRLRQVMEDPRGGERLQRLPAAEGGAMQFLALYQNQETAAPPTPTTVFDPSGIRPTQLNNLSPRSMITGDREGKPLLVFRAAALGSSRRPNGPEQASMKFDVNDRTRRERLLRIAGSSELRKSLEGFASALALGALPPSWEYQSEGGRPTSRLLLESSTWQDRTASALKAELTFAMGPAALGPGDAALAAIRGILDVTLRFGDDSASMPLAQVRDLLVASAAVFDLTTVAGEQLLAHRSDEWEAALWIFTSRASLAEAIDIAEFEATSPVPSPNELWVNTTLPLDEPFADPRLGVHHRLAKPETALAVEAIRRLLQEANRRDYEQTLHRLLRGENSP